MTQATTALAAALQDDPFYRAVTITAENEAARLDMLAQYFDHALEEARHVGDVQIAGDDGAAIWVTDIADAATVAAESARRTAALGVVLGDKGVAAYAEIGAAMEALVPDHLADSWYLSILGVRPEARGRGIARDLLAPTLAKADIAGATSFLETFNPLSLPFYQRLGFVDQIALHEPVTDRPYWLMWRQR
ncbi:hypothetical protein WH87_11985 [Devosia epidermidihirudinis]|uniref:N-acetyltransferase domain-containing protein n=1 Tax=Devosia epidermidihirudinis TaxID=1293439 RepID=A0A0F5Q943_9HYPH|nr:GNAT family N-acetyltransferase [Devosia epidermidihirudinis]KKC37273.1 hypothetical protein WH87_11985 [Devosia epidermidihirudinis]